MAIGCGAKCAKFLLIVFNAIFWLSGACVLGVGIWLRVDPSAVKIFDLAATAQGDNTFEIACYILIGIGAFVFLVGFLGCCGAIKESKCMLGLYIFALVLVFVVELAAGILAALYKDTVTDELKGGIQTALNNEDYFGNAEQTKYTAWGLAVNFAQAQYNLTFPYSCCDLKSGSDLESPLEEDVDDWAKCQAKQDGYFYNEYGIPFPYTCCKLKSMDDKESAVQDDVEDWTACQAEDENQFYKTPCYDAVMDWINDKMIILIGVGIGIAFLEIFGLLFAICLCRNVGEED